MDGSPRVRLDKFLLRCPFCKRGFSRKADMDNHRLCVNLTSYQDEKNNTIKHEIKGERNTVERFSCPTCGEIFNRWSVFCRHALFHTYFIVMEDSSRKVSILKRNMKDRIISPSSRTAEFNFSPKSDKTSRPKCNDQSGRKFKMCRKKVQKSSFKKRCRVCGRTFYENSNLHIHMRVHSNHRPYKCKFCPCRFKQLSHVNNHERIHTGELPWECSLCGFKCRQKSNLNYHLKKNH